MKHCPNGEPCMHGVYHPYYCPHFCTAVGREAAQKLQEAEAATRIKTPIAEQFSAINERLKQIEEAKG